MDSHSSSHRATGSKKKSLSSSSDRTHRPCHHRGQRKVVEEAEVVDPVVQRAPSPIHEETEQEIADVLTLEERPVTAASVGKSGRSSVSPGPNNRVLHSRPGSSRSVFEQLLGTRPASRRTISRNSTRSRKSRQSDSSRGIDRGAGSDSDSDDERKARDSGFEGDYHPVDIHDEKAFDTDLEAEEREIYIYNARLQLKQMKGPKRKKVKDRLQRYIDQTATYDHTGKTAYIEDCKKLGVVPASYFLRHMNDRQLSMKHHGLGAVGMRAVADSLTSNTQVLELDLSDNWLGPQGGISVCDMLRENCFITELNLSDNRLGNACAEPLSQIMLQNVTLTHITLSGNGFDDNSAQYFYEAIMNTTKVQYLCLSHNNFGEVSGIVLGPAIADNTSLKELDLSWNCLRRKGAIGVAQGIKNNVFMKKINLSWNGFGLEGSVALQDALKMNSVLEELDVSNNRIMTEGAVLIGKGLSQNETLKILKIGQNPLQSGGCYGICAAIIRNPGCVIQELDFTDILVNNDFEDVYKLVLEQIPNLKLTHGGSEPPPKPKAKVHPMVKLANYIEKHDLRLVDFFNRFDKDGSMSVTHEEFVEGIESAKLAILKRTQETGIKLSEDEVNQLLNELDRDGDGEINYNELVIGHSDFQEKRHKINTVLTVMQPRPLTT